MGCGFSGAKVLSRGVGLVARCHTLPSDTSASRGLELSPLLLLLGAPNSFQEGGGGRCYWGVRTEYDVLRGMGTIRGNTR